MTQATSPEEMELARAGSGRKAEVLRWVNTLGPLAGLVLVYAFFAAVGPESFSTANSMETMARQTVIVGMAAIGMTVVMIGGGIDLSVGSVVALATVVTAYSMRRGSEGVDAALRLNGYVLGSLGAIALLIGYVWTAVKAFRSRARDGLLCAMVPFFWVFYAWRRLGRARTPLVNLAVGTACSVLALLVYLLYRSGLDGDIVGFFGRHMGAWAIMAALMGVLYGVLCGFVSGVLITGLKVVPFIVTLGMMLLVRGAAKGLAREQKVDAPALWVRELTASVSRDLSWLVLPPGVWMVVLFALVVAGMLRYTRLGRHTFAVGSNELTARLCGVPVERVKVIVYTLNGLFGGLAGVMLFSFLSGQAEPNVADGLELKVIAAVVIGGGSLAGGEGSVFGTLMGALIMTVIESGCTQMGLSNWVQQIVTGIIIVLAVTLDRMRHRLAG